VTDRLVNLLELPLEEAGDDTPPAHAFRGERLTEGFEAAATGMSIYELDPGLSCWPYHFEVSVEEWLIVISGELMLRTPDGERELRAGDVACFRAGAAGAHAVRNHGAVPVRYAMSSTSGEYGGATVYPDSGKVNVYTDGFRHRAWLGEPVPYWEGEA
jgi:uncharacterized cupin superfamily protein